MWQMGKNCPCCHLIVIFNMELAVEYVTASGYSVACSQALFSVRAWLGENGE